MIDVNMNPNDESICLLLADIAKALVDESDAVTAEAHQAEGSTTLTLTVAPSDVGKVIGKQGRMARSIRTILSAVSMKMKRHYSLDVRAIDRPEQPKSSHF
jgi:predicted RNA-binding protein YlqC (UPF0109 family)